jgi:hypothetical protein
MLKMIGQNTRISSRKQGLLWRCFVRKVHEKQPVARTSVLQQFPQVSKHQEVSILECVTSHGGRKLPANATSKDDKSAAEKYFFSSPATEKIEMMPSLLLKSNRKEE